MPLPNLTGVQVDSWVDMARDVPMRYEIDKLNERATLYFGQDENYVLCLHRDDLAQVIDLASRGLNDLDQAVESTQPAPNCYS